MRAFALVSGGDREAVDVFLREEDALAALDAAVADEPEWIGLLRVEQVELDETQQSPN